MNGTEPLDRPVWSALTGRQAGVAIGGPRGLRFLPDHAPFAALPGPGPHDPDVLAGLVATAPAWLLDRAPWPAVPGLAVLRQATYLQMIPDRIASPVARIAWHALGDGDTADMQSLAALTKPGPFLAKTDRLGRFIGIRVEGRLVAMAGERLKPDGFTEISAVCTHPEHRGRGHAGLLIRLLATRIFDRGERPFLHCRADDAAAIALYQALGFSIHRPIILTVLGPDAAASY